VAEPEVVVTPVAPAPVEPVVHVAAAPGVAVQSSLGLEPIEASAPVVVPVDEPAAVATAPAAPVAPALPVAGEPPRPA